MSRAQDKQEWDVRYKTVFPHIMSRLKALKTQNMLDYGCGYGVFVNMASSAIPGKVYGYDISEMVRRVARRDAVPSVEIIDDMKEIPHGSLDTVTMNAVWMQFHDARTCLDVLKRIHTALKPGGTLIASVTHPCFRDHKFFTHETDFERKNYLKSGTPFTAFVRERAAPIEKWSDFHWTMADHINQLTASGFNIISLNEVPDDSGLSQWMILEARKA